MDILDWITVSILAMIFLMVLFYTLKDIMKDRRFYVQKSKNVTPIHPKMRKKNVSKR